MSAAPTRELALNRLDDNKLWKGCLISEPGNGKTVAGIGFPKPLYLADFDGKAGSGSNFYRGEKWLEQVTVGNFQKNPEILNDEPITRFRAKLAEWEALCRKKDEKFPFATIMTDSLTFAGLEMLGDIVKKHSFKRASKDSPCQADFGVLLPNLSNLINRLLALPCNIVLTTHYEMKQDDKTKVLEIVPLIPGKNSKMLGAKCPEMYLLTVNKEGKYMATKKPFGRFSFLRSQLKTLPVEFEMKWENIAPHL